MGKAVNPLSVEGQIEGGVVMSMGYALTEQYPIDANCKPTAKYGMLGLFRANQIPPEIQAIAACTQFSYLLIKPLVLDRLHGNSYEISAYKEIQ